MPPDGGPEVGSYRGRQQHESSTGCVGDGPGLANVLPVPSVVVSLHDCAPPHLDGLRALLRALDGFGASPRVLKVVPNYAGSWPLRESAELVQLLHLEVAAGSELVLHGYTHRTAGRLEGGPAARVRARWFAPRDAEFLSLPPEEAESRLRAGLEELAACGLKAAGFCAPAWLAAPWTVDLLRRLGFRYHVTMGCVHDLATGRRVPTPWFGAVGTGGVHELLVHAGGFAGAWLSRTGYPVVKAFFHPQRPETWGPQLARLRRALRGRRCVTYSALLNA